MKLELILRVSQHLS